MAESQHALTTGVADEASSSTISGGGPTPSSPLSSDRAAVEGKVANYSRCLQEPPGIESGDYDLHESQQYLTLLEAQSEAIKRYPWCPRTLGRTGRRWLLVIVAGAGAGAVATIIDQGTRWIIKLRLYAMEALIDADQLLINQYIVFLCMSLALVAVAACMVCFVEPLASGSGIPEIKCFLNGTHLPRVLHLRTLMAKVFGIICSVSAGMPAGKEGPMIHSGAIMGSLVSQPFESPLLQPKSFDRERRDLVAAGAAAGVAAAFSAPLGGVLFAIEEGASWMNVTIMLRTFVCALTAALVQRFFAGGFEGEPWGRLGHDGYPLEFGHMPDLQYRVWDLPVIALVAALCGIFGAVWNFINIRLARWRKRRVGQTGLRRWTEAMFAGAVVATLNYWAPVLVFDSAAEGLSRETRTSVLSWNGQAHAIELLFTSEHRFDSIALLVLFVTHFLTGCWAFGLGIPCGIFVPTLTSGAALGRLIGQGLYTIGYIDHTKDVGAYALIGAGGLLAGVARITISLSVILLEAVQNQTFALPLFMTTLVAKQAGNHFNEGIYDMLIKLRGIPLMELGVEKDSIHRKAQEVMATELVTLSPVEEAGKLLAKLEGCHHNAFPVVDSSSGLFLGLARRKMLERVLSSTTFPNDGGLLQLPSGPLASPAPKVSFGGISRRPCGLDVVRAALGEEDLRRRVDVRPFMNDACYTVLEHTSLLRCYELFRTMGLRHLPVVDRSGVIRGILTRKDLILAEEFLHVAGEHHKRKAALAGTGTESTVPARPTRNKDNDPASPRLLAE